MDCDTWRSSLKKSAQACARVPGKASWGRCELKQALEGQVATTQRGGAGRPAQEEGTKAGEQGGARVSMAAVGGGGGIFMIEDDLGNPTKLGFGFFGPPSPRTVGLTWGSWKQPKGIVSCTVLISSRNT